MTHTPPPASTPKGTNAPPEKQARAEKDRAYRQAYWADYKKKRRRVHGTLSPAEHAEIARVAEAAGRPIWTQIWAESQAYRAQAFLPNEDIERQIETLHVELRRIGNNLNQLAKTGNIFGRLRRPSAVMKQVEALEQTVAVFTSRPWGRSPKAPDQAPPSSKPNRR